MSADSSREPCHYCLYRQYSALETQFSFYSFNVCSYQHYNFSSWDKCLQQKQNQFIHSLIWVMHSPAWHSSHCLALKLLWSHHEDSWCCCWFAWWSSSQQSCSQPTGFAISNTHPGGCCGAEASFWGWSTTSPCSMPHPLELFIDLASIQRPRGLLK